MIVSSETGEKMRQKDILEKSIMQRREVFAEVFNLFVFSGKRVIRPEGLHTVNTVSQRDDGRHREMVRDILHEYQDQDIGLMCFLGIENQEYICDSMPVRNMGYDWNLYASQVKNRKGKRILPVYTLVLNWTDRRWGGITDLADMFEKKIMKQFPELVTSYPIHAADMMFLENEVIRRMNTELKQICMVFRYRSDEKMLDKLLQDPAYERLSAEAADLIALKLNIKMKFTEEEKELGEINMCRAWEKIKKDEYNRGAEVQKTEDDMKIAELMAKSDAEKAELMAKIDAEKAELKAKSDAERSEFIRREQILLQEIRKLKALLDMPETS